MLSRLRYFVKYLPPTQRRTDYSLCARILMCHNRTPIQFYSKHSLPSSDSDIIDVINEKLMPDNDDSNSHNNYEPQPHAVTSTDSTDGVIAPIDIDPWIDEELEKDGTVDMEYVEKERQEIHYPEPPKERSGYYEFEGIKIWLPKKMLTPATYRYRLTEEEEQTLPDDIRICKFEKFKPTS